MKVWYQLLSHVFLLSNLSTALSATTTISIKTIIFFLCIRVVQGFVPFPSHFLWLCVSIAKISVLPSPAQPLSLQVHEGGRSARPGSEAGSHLQSSGCESGRRAAQRSKARSCWGGGRRRCVSLACFVTKGTSHVVTRKLIEQFFLCFILL